MAYTLQALIGEVTDVKCAAPSDAVVIALPQSMGLVPFSRSMRDAHGISLLPLTDEGTDIPEGVQAIAARAKKIAYVEAEFFGGAGTQASVVWEEGRLLFGPVVADDAINQALRMLGVAKKEHLDEFAELSLGRHRDTDEWK
jgi:hypothetical protein